jgi:hypothetical protein
MRVLRPASVVRIGRKVRRLSWSDWAELPRALLVALAIEAGLRTMRMPTLARLLGVPLETREDRPAVPMVSWLPGWAMRRLYLSSRVMDVWPFGGTCLRRSLLAGHRLRSLHPVLRVGVTRAGSELGAHAWVEIDGRFYDPEATNYHPLQDMR